MKGLYYEGSAGNFKQKKPGREKIYGPVFTVHHAHTISGKVGLVQISIEPVIDQPISKLLISFNFI